MNSKSKINAIKVMLGLQVKLESAKLADGVTVVETESFEIGFPLFVTNADGTKSLAPVGEHVLEDGTKVVVDEQGTITEIVKPSEGESETPEVEIEVEAETTAPTETETETVNEDIKETFKKLALVVEEIAKEVSDIKTEMKSMKEKYEKFAASPAALKFPSVTPSTTEKVDPLEAKIAFIQSLKEDKFFKIK